MMPDGLSFARASSAYAFGADGTLRAHANNVPRFEYDMVTGQPLGLLLESTRTNLHPRSSQLASWSNNGALSTTNDVYISPDGTQNASEIVAGGAYGGRYVYVTGLSADTYYALSGYIKVFSGSSLIKVGAETSEDTSYQGNLVIDTSTGVISSYGSKTYDRYSVLLPNGWVYFRYYVKTGAAQTSLSYLAFAHSAASTFSVWGAQVEAGMSATSYIPTSGTAATRAGEMISTTNIPWFNRNEGTILVENLDATTSENSIGAEFNNDTWNERIVVGEGTSTLTCGIYVGGVSQSFVPLARTNTNAPYKHALSYKQDAVQAAHNGALSALDTAANMPTSITRLRLGYGGVSNSFQINGYIKRFRYWSRAFSDAELERITA